MYVIIRNYGCNNDVIIGVIIRNNVCNNVVLIVFINISYSAKLSSNKVLLSFDSILSVWSNVTILLLKSNIN